MNFAFNLGAFLFAAGLARNGLTQTPPSPLPNVPAIFANLIPKVTVLTNATASFASGGNAGSLTQALGIYSGGQTLIAAIDSSTNSILALPFTPVPDDIGMAIYNQFLALEPIITQGLNDLTSKKDAFNALLPGPLAALGNPQYIITGNLMALKSSFVRFKVAVLGVTSPDILIQVQPLPERIQAALDAAITSYSS